METTLSEWASIAEIVGAVAVTVSLVFVGFQIRKNAVATRAATLQSSVSYDVHILTTVGATPGAAAALYGFSFEPRQLDAEQRMQGLWLFASTVRHWENLYLQRLSGTLSADAWRAREAAVNATVLCPGWDEYMSSVLGAFMGGPFMEYAQRIRARTPAPPKPPEGRDSQVA